MATRKLHKQIQQVLQESSKIAFGESEDLVDSSPFLSGISSSTELISPASACVSHSEEIDYLFADVPHSRGKSNLSTFAYLLITGLLLFSMQSVVRSHYSESFSMLSRIFLPINKSSIKPSVQVAVSKVNVRSSGSMKGAIVGKLKAGEKVVVKKTAGSWKAIYKESKAGKGNHRLVGYVYGRLLSKP